MGCSGLHFNLLFPLRHPMSPHGISYLIFNIYCTLGLISNIGAGKFVEVKLRGT